LKDAPEDSEMIGTFTSTYKQVEAKLKDLNDELNEVEDLQ